MKIKVIVARDEDIYDVCTNVDGSWLFTWKDAISGRPLESSWEESWVKKNLASGAWVVVSAKPLTTEKYIDAFNKWMQDYINNPDNYESTYDSAIKHLKEKLDGKEPSYGEICAAILVKYLEKGETK